VQKNLKSQLDSPFLYSKSSSELTFENFYLLLWRLLWLRRLLEKTMRKKICNRKNL